MKWDFQTVGFNASKELQEYTRSKIEKLDHYYDQIVGAEVYLKLVQDDHDQNKVAEIKLNIPGKDIFANAQSEVFEKSVNMVTEKVKAQIRKLKTRQSAH